MERNLIFSLQSHGKALEKECCLPGVFCDSDDMPANLLCELNGHLMPYTNCFYGKWVEDVCAGQFGVIVYLVLRCLLGCCTWFSCCAANVVLSICVWYCHIPGHWLPLAHGKRVVPSGRLLSSRIRLSVSLTAGIWARLLLFYFIFLIIIWLFCEKLEIYFESSGTCSTMIPSLHADELHRRKVNRQRRARLEMRHTSRVRRQENRQMGFGEYFSSV